ncbi:MAG: UDP-N-acetylmuramoyl-L-alanyl-D-glutamate--2,6-diaminopimelate ligase [Clostridia bacterium]|nr:UDP-N-acetylmuramoyl-L-alanyl-D-glutamate--2,6-diaminopimelate ligase [Clostridia bacterium]
MKLNDFIGSVPKELANIELTGITNDSRNVKSGYAFVCIVGSASDGHDYAEKALQNGASVIITERDIGIKNQLIVADTHKAYADGCAAFFGNPADKLKLIGITGTNGKTTVTYLVKSVLEQLGKKVGLIGTIKNMIGDVELEAKNTTPEPYELHGLFKQMVDSGCEYCVMEVSSHALDQKRVNGLHFAVAGFTNISQDHLDYHGTMENYVGAKKKLFEMCDCGVFNADDECVDMLMENIPCKKVTYSVNNNVSDYIAKGVVCHSDGVVFELIGNSVINRIKLKTPGKFSVYNGLCAASMVMSLGFSFESVTAALSKSTAVKGRAEVVPTGRDFTVIIDYAHTPDGIINILSTMREIKKGRLVALFGCGGDRDRTKRPLMAAATAKLADFVIITSDNPRSEKPESIIDDIVVGMNGFDVPYEVIVNRADAINWAIKNAKTDDLIVLMGKGHETYQILADKTIHFDEREVVAQALSSLDNIGE